MSEISPSTVVILGAQRFDPSLGASVSELRVGGKIATITAGWQEREPEDEELSEHLGGRTVNLRLHARAEELFRDDLELRDAHRARQDALRHRQDFYRIRLEHELEAAHVMRQRHAPPDILADEIEASFKAIRELDAWHLAMCARIRSEFEEQWDLARRPSIRRHREELASIIEGCDAIAIAGGQVATLVNRLALFGIRDLVRGRTVFAWSGGAMAISERVVLFHDSPPQGPGASEVLDAGMGILKGVVVLPQPEQRLRLDDPERVQRMVRRFAPARCVALPARSRVTWRAGQLERPQGVIELHADGTAGPLDGHGHTPKELA